MGTWLINNAADGFGIALTAELLARGHTVAGIVRDEQQRRIYETCFAARPLCYLLRLHDTDALRAVVDEIEALGGEIEALVNNDDGHARRALFDAVSLDQVREHFERSVFGAVSLIQAVLLAAVARHPPRRLLLGGRALRDMRRRIGELQDELSDWELVSLNTGRPGWQETAG